MMRPFRLFKYNIDEPWVPLNSDEYHHLTRVMKVGVGSEGDIIVNGNMIWQVAIKSISKSELSIDCQSKEPIPQRNYPAISLIQSLPKGDKMSDILRSCTEVGIDSFYPVTSERSIPSLKNSTHKEKRWRTVIESAAIQSKQYSVPQLHSVSSLRDTLNSLDTSQSLCIVAWEETDMKQSIKTVLQSSKQYRSIIVVIGPEGGLSDSDIDLLKEYSFIPCSLGEPILRAEHAAFYTAAAILYEWSE